MRVFSAIASLLLLAILGLFVHQNLSTFTNLLPFTLDLHINESFGWSLRVYTVMGIAALLGFIFGLGVMLKPYVRIRRALADERRNRQPLQEMPVQSDRGDPSVESQPPPREQTASNSRDPEMESAKAAGTEPARESSNTANPKSHPEPVS